MWNHSLEVKAGGIHIRRLKYVVAGVVFVHFMSTSVWGATITWDGGANSLGNWSGPGKGGNEGHRNWTGDTPPTNGDSLLFQNSTRLSNTNNISNLSIVNLTFDSTAGPFIMGGNAITLTGNVTNNSTSLQTIGMALGLSAGDHIFATSAGNMTISGAISGSGGITKTGSQQLNLTGSNTYTGNTTVSEGTLSFSNNFSVSSGATVGGAGTIVMQSNANLDISGKIAPGNGTTPGTLTINLSSTTSELSMSSGASFEFHLGTSGLNMSNVGVSDMLAIVGASSGDFDFNNNNINFMGTGQAGFYKLFDTSTNNANTWSGLTVDINGQITAGLTYSNLSGGRTATFHMGGYSLGGTTGDIYVQVIPEPSVALMGGLGAFVIVFRRRRSLQA